MEDSDPYAVGLRRMTVFDDRSAQYRALESLREVIAGSDGSQRSSAILLVALLSVTFGDDASFDVLQDQIVENRPPDAFAAKHVAQSWLTVGFGREFPLLAAPCLHALISRPLIGLHLVRSASLFAQRQLSAAAEALETIVGPASVDPIEEPWSHPPPLTGSGEQLAASEDYDYRPADEFEEALCLIYKELDDPDGVLDVVRRFPESDLTMQRGDALEQKGALGRRAPRLWRVHRDVRAGTCQEKRTDDWRII